MTHATAQAIGIDIGGTRLRAALVDGGGRILERTETATAARAGPAAVVAQITELVAQIAPRDGPMAPVGVGVSCPGPLDTERGVALGVPTLANWVDVPIATMIADRLEMPVRLENDGIAAAHGEWRFGAGRGLEHMIYATISTGIGGGVVSDGALLHGRLGMAGHIGHMTIAQDGALCSCGNHGCWEAYASGTAFTRRIRAHGGNWSEAGPAEIFGQARQGDAEALALVAEEADLLGVGIANLLHLYSPQMVVLGGGVANGFSLLEAGIRERVMQNAMPAFRDVAIVVAELGDNAGLVGAATLMLAPS